MVCGEGIGMLAAFERFPIVVVCYCCNSCVYLGV